MTVLPLRAPDPATSRPTQFAGFDAIRALAALGVVLLHSCVPYVSYPMPGLAWPVRDGESSLVGWGFWWIELFIMPLFLTLAGFLAWQTLRHRGAKALVRSRANRLLKPLVFGIIFILPLDLYAWVLGWVAEGLVAPVKLKSLKFDAGVDRDLWGLSHLWFLQYLFMYVVAVALVAVARERWTAVRRFEPSVRTLTILVLTIGSIVLYVRPEVVWGFQHGFVPFASKWLYSGLFFVVGAMLAAHDSQLLWLKSRAARLVAPALVFSIAAVALGRWHLSGEDHQLAQVTLAGLTCCSAFLLTLSVVGLAVRHVDRVPSVISYLAAASFWVYILHHPFLGLIHLDLKWLFPNASPVVKTVAAFALTSGFCLLTYEGLVRKTKLGHWLGFAWQPRATANDVISIREYSHEAEPREGVKRAA